MSVREYIVKSFDKEYEQKSLPELRKAPVAALSGVNQTDADSLKNAFGIDNIQELALNKYVLLSQAINTFSKYSGKILDKEFNSAEFEELRKKPVSAIAGVSETDATLLKNAFGINSIQDLAENKYVKVAQLVNMSASLFEMTETVKTPQQASLPKPPQTPMPSQPTQPQQTTQPTQTSTNQPTQTPATS
jgi:predicted RecB family nuclease